MLDKIRWLIQGIVLYLDSAALFFQPLSINLRVPIFLVVSLTLMLGVNLLTGSAYGYESWYTKGSTLFVAIMVAWIGYRIVLRFPPDDFV